MNEKFNPGFLEKKEVSMSSSNILKVRGGMKDE